MPAKSDDVLRFTMRGFRPKGRIKRPVVPSCAATITVSHSRNAKQILGWKAVVVVNKERHFGCWRARITDAVEVLLIHYADNIPESQMRQLRAGAEVMQARRERTLPSGTPDAAEFGVGLYSSLPVASGLPDVLYVSHVHQIYGLFKDDQPMNKMFASSHQAWKTTASNMGAEYHLWTSDEVETLIRTKYYQFWDMYKNCRFPVMRADISRVAILHAYGGLYADLDTKPNRNWYAQAYLAVGSIMGPPGGGWKKTDWRGAPDEDAKPRKEQWDMEVLVAEMGALFLLKWLEYMEAQIAERPYSNPKKFWGFARMRYIYNTTGPVSMRRFLEQPVNKGLLARTLFLKMNWFKDEPKLTRQDRLQFEVITAESNSYFTKQHENIVPVGTETVALPMVPTRLRNKAKSKVPCLRQPSQATSQDAEDLNHQLEALKKVDAKRSADIERLVEDHQYDSLRILELRETFQDYASARDFLRIMPVPLRKWILGLPRGQEQKEEGGKEFDDSGSTERHCCVAPRSPSTRLGPFGKSTQAAKKRNKRRRVPSSSPG